MRHTVPDALVIAGRELTHWVRAPLVLVAGIAFPVLMLLMFGYLLGGGLAVPGGSGTGGADYRELLVPGILGLTMAFGVEATTVAVGEDARRGITDRLRAMPTGPGAVVLGRSLADLVTSVVVLAALLAVGLLVGWEASGGAGGFLAAAGLLLLLRFALLWPGMWLGLATSAKEAVLAVQILVWPVAFASAAFVDPATMPAWLGAVAEWNPLTATVAAARELFGNPGWGGDSWAARNPVLLALLWPAVLTAVFAPLAATRWRNLAR